MSCSINITPPNPACRRLGLRCSFDFAVAQLRSGCSFALRLMLSLGGLREKECRKLVLMVAAAGACSYTRGDSRCARAQAPLVSGNKPVRLAGLSSGGGSGFSFIGGCGTAVFSNWSGILTRRWYGFSSGGAPHSRVAVISATGHGVAFSELNGRHSGESRSWANVILASRFAPVPQKSRVLARAWPAPQ